jgi:hypothetical protein
MSLFAPHTSAQVEEPLNRILDKSAADVRGVPLMVRVGQVLLHRVKFTARLLFWSARHRSFARGRWLAEYEGYSWN